MITGVDIHFADTRPWCGLCGGRMGDLHSCIRQLGNGRSVRLVQVSGVFKDDLEGWAKTTIGEKKQGDMETKR